VNGVQSRSCFEAEMKVTREMRVYCVDISEIISKCMLLFVVQRLKECDINKYARNLEKW
jgi:hypothetical protein